MPILPNRIYFMKIVARITNRVLVLLSLAISSYNLQAQDTSWFNNSTFNKYDATYSPCYVIKKDGTLMQCYAMANKLYSPKGTFQYLETTEGKRKGIKVKELQSIQFKKKRYEAITPEEGGREYMALKAVEGEVSLYVFKELKHIYLPIPFPYGGGGVVKIPYDKYYRFLKSNNQFVNVKKGKFKESMVIYFNKQASVVEKINSEAYNFLNMEIMVAEYNSLNSGIHNWTEKPMSFEEIRPKENCSFFCRSSKAANSSGPKLATVYIYNKPNKKNTSSFEVYVEDSLVRQFNNGSVFKYQYDSDAIKEFTVVNNTIKSSCKILINPGRVYYLQNIWDEKIKKYVLKPQDPVAGQYFVDQNNKTNSKIF